MGLTLQPAARRDLVDVAVNVDLQQRARMIGGTSGRFWDHTVKAQRPEIQLIDKHVDHPNRVVLSNVVIQILGKQNALSTVFTLDEARHLTPRCKSSKIITQQAFSHSLHPTRPSARVVVNGSLGSWSCENVSAEGDRRRLAQLRMLSQLRAGIDLDCPVRRFTGCLELLPGRRSPRARTLSRDLSL